jgi:putative DNA primase/helicase
MNSPTVFPIDSSTLLGHALDYAARGWLIFPLAPGSKKPLARSRGFRDATADPVQIRHWWQHTPNANIGLRCGAESGVVVLDLDLYKPGADLALEALETRYGPLPETLASVTPHRGSQRFFRHPGDHVDIRPSASARGIGIDIRADDSYVALPPSVLADCPKAYVWEDVWAEPSEAMAACPAWIWTEDSSRHARPSPESSGGPIPQGARNDTLCRCAGAMRRAGMAVEEILDALRTINRRCQPPLAERELRRIATSIGRYAPAAADHHHLPKSGLRTIAAPRVLVHGGLRTIDAKEVGTWR